MKWRWHVGDMAFRVWDSSARRNTAILYQMESHFAKATHCYDYDVGFWQWKFSSRRVER